MVSVTDTIEDGKAWLRARLIKGDTCPLCHQHAQMYRWSLYSTAAQALILFYRLGGTTDFVHSRDLKDHGHRGHGDASRLLHWGLVEEEKTITGPGARSGYWRVTSLGEQFVLGHVNIPKYAWVYNSGVYKLEGDLISIHDALGTKFSYSALMHPST